MLKSNGNKRKRQMLKVAIVGNIASGKSTVEQVIEDNGFKVYDTDKIAHEILESSNEVLKEFGTIDRKEIAKIVFSNSKKLQLLESIIHPKVKEEILKIFDCEENFVFVSVPQLFEAGFESMFDKIIYITADENLRKERLIKRNNFTPEEAQKRIDVQNNAGKAEKADFVIKNNSTIDELNTQVEKILSILIR